MSGCMSGSTRQRPCCSPRVCTPGWLEDVGAQFDGEPVAGGGVLRPVAGRAPVPADHRPSEADGGRRLRYRARLHAAGAAAVSASGGPKMAMAGGVTARRDRRDDVRDDRTVDEHAGVADAVDGDRGELRRGR